MEFSSANYHKGRSLSRKDDMVSLLYLLSYLLEGELPWSSEVRNMKKTEYEKSRQVIDIKDEADQKLFRKYPELQQLFNYTLELKFTEKPQYPYYVSTFSQMLEKRGLAEDKVYDWMLLDEEGEGQEMNHQF